MDLPQPDTFGQCRLHGHLLGEADHDGLLGFRYEACGKQACR